MAFDKNQLREIREIVVQSLVDLGLLPRYDQRGVTTGRMSCEAPNYPNPPRYVDPIVRMCSLDDLAEKAEAGDGDGEPLMHIGPMSEHDIEELRALAAEYRKDPHIQMYENKRHPDVVAAMGLSTPRPRYSLLGVTLHQSYNGAMLTTGIVVKAVAYTAEEAKELTTTEIIEKCGGTCLWIDLTTGQAATDV